MVFSFTNTPLLFFGILLRITSSHIGKALGLSQPTIFKSIQSLENDKFIQTRQEYQRGKRTLTLTDKGGAVAPFSGNEKGRIHSYLQRRAPSSTLLLLMDIVKDKNDLNSEWMRLFIEHMLCQEQKLNESDEKKKEELIATLIVGPKNGFVDARKLRRLLERSVILRLIEMLRNKIKSTNSIIDQLMSEETNEPKPKPTIMSNRQPLQIFKITGLKSKVGLKNSILAEILKDTTKEMVSDIYRVGLSKLLETLEDEKSDQLRLQVNKADGEMSITPISKRTDEHVLWHSFTSILPIACRCFSKSKISRCASCIDTI